MGSDVQLYVVRADGEERRQVTLDPAVGLMGAWNPGSTSSVHSWPGWSPDDRWLATFRSEASDEDESGPTALTVLEVDGVRERQLLSLTDSQPIYARWSPDGAGLALLTQEGDGLVLTRVAADEVGDSVEVVRGVPLFFSWVDAERLVAHVGDQRSGVSRIIIDDGDERQNISEQPGSFCTPLSVDGKVVYALGRGRRSRISITDLHTGRRRDLTELEGLLALVGPPSAHPEKPLLVSAAPGGEHTPYDGIWLLEQPTGLLQRIVDEPVMAFQWDPTGARVVFAVLDAERSRMSFRVWEEATGTVREVCDFWPSRDQLFFFHFLEQFADSHSQVSPDGRTLVFSGYLDPRRVRDAADETDDGPVIQVVDLLDPQGGALPLAPGRFAVFSHA